MANLRNYKELESVCNMAGLQLTTDASHITIRKGLACTPTWCVNYWTQGDVDMLTDMVDSYSVGDVTWFELVHYEDSMRDVADEYVKDSYRDGKDKVLTIVETAFKGCGYSMQLLNKLESFDFDKTSAILYKGIYITPSMIRVCVDYIFNKMTASQQKDLITLTGMTEKELIEDATKRLALGETPESFETMDLIRGV